MKSIITLLLFISMITTSLFANSIRIMPLGDSITYGYPSDSGYRNYLWYKLEDAKYIIDFIGSQDDGYTVTPSFDYNHEGYGGWKTYDIASIVYTLLEDNQPDVILLHIGSNDTSPTQGVDSSSVTGLNNILNEIDEYERNYNHPITVILASIINRRTYHQTITDFNINLRALATSRITNGDKITLVDMESGAVLTSSDFTDATYSNDNGYAKMADVWFDKLDEVLPKDDYAWLVAVNHIILN